MLAVKIALILIQKDSDQEDDVVWEVEAVELRKTGKSKKEKSKSLKTDGLRTGLLVLQIASKKFANH